MYRCHKQEGKKIFEKAMNENEIYVCVDGIEEHLEGNIENSKIRMSIVTREMLKYDIGMADKLGYCPYFSHLLQIIIMSFVHI